MHFNHFGMILYMHLEVLKILLEIWYWDKTKGIKNLFYDHKHDNDNKY